MKVIVDTSVWSLALRRSKDVEDKHVKELEEFYDMAVGRELRMKQLKEENEELKDGHRTVFFSRPPGPIHDDEARTSRTKFSDELG